MRLNLSDIAVAVGAVGDLGDGPEIAISRVVTDSRKVTRGDLFVCLPGEKFDGHGFAAEAVRKGALAVLVQRPLLEDIGAPWLLVPDTLAALGRLAGWVRCRMSAKFVGVSGSTGKTTLKEILAGILSVSGKTARNYRNWNNTIGLPLSVLAADGDEEFVVLEAGINLMGEMDCLGAILQPDLVVIHNVGPVHLEGLGSVAGVAEQKCRLLGYLRPGGVGLVSADYPELEQAARTCFHRVLTFSSKGRPADFTARRLVVRDSGQDCEFNLAGAHFRATLPWGGDHMLENALAAMAAASLLGLDPEDIVKGLAAVCLPTQRFECREIGTWTVIDDTYNANPMSMSVSVDSARERAGEGELILVLGGMRELGPLTAQAHLELGSKIASVHPTAVFFTGEGASELELGLREGGYDGFYARVSTPTEFLSGLRNCKVCGGVILFKGSRSYMMENYLQAFARENRS